MGNGTLQFSPIIYLCVKREGDNVLNADTKDFASKTPTFY